MSGGVDDGYSDGLPCPAYIDFDPGSNFRQVVIIGGGMSAGKTAMIEALQKLKGDLRSPLTIIDDPCFDPKPKPYMQPFLSKLSRVAEKPKANNGPAYRRKQAHKWSNKWNSKIK